ncbi:MAG TPA: transglycosylase SLT domain-containing protein [Thermoanaerobaculia bacterium]|nr:transglycosylase SLT domain-containing protein [Thermoanaerobaculia bacterium]
MDQGRVVASLLVVAAMAGCAKPPAPQPVVVPATAAATAEAPPKDRRTLAREALALFDAKRYDEAVPALNAAAVIYPEVAPFLHLRVVESEVARGNFANAAAAASEIIALGDSSAATVARLRLPAIYAQLGDVSSTDAAFAQAMRIGIDELTESDFVAMANALAKANRADLASRVRMRLLTEYTQGRFTEQTYGQLKSEIEKLPDADKLALADKLSRADRYDQALELFSQLPQSADNVRAVRLRALFNSRNYEQILAETKDVTLTDASLLLLRARAAWRADQPALMLAGLAQIEKDFPASREAAEAKVIRAKYYVTDEVDYGRSLENLSKAIDAGVLGTDGENLWNLGWTYTLAGQDEQALKTFDRYIAAYADGDWRTNSLFWSAKVLDRLGRTTERDAKAKQIVTEYPFSYYAYRAKELWPTSNQQPATSNTFPDLDSELAKLTEPRLATVRELLEVNLARAAAREMKLLAAKYADNPGVQFMLADVYVRGGEPFKANGVLQRQFRAFVRHGGANIPPRFWQILFPLPYWDAIRDEAQRRGLDPYLVASIIRQESGFEPSTVSNAGAVGLMQIMPEEASRIATDAELGAVSREDLFDPAKNIAVGAAEYSQKLAAMSGNHTLAIASYNAGETAVERWIARAPVNDTDVFIESIPFAETRLYVKTVTRNRNEYKRIYETTR